MAKIRVHELAKKLNMSNQDLLVKLQALRVDAKTHSSNIDEQEALKALGLLGGGEDASKKPRTMLRRRRDEGVSESTLETTPEADIVIQPDTFAREDAATSVATQAILEEITQPSPTDEVLHVENAPVVPTIIEVVEEEQVAAPAAAPMAASAPAPISAPTPEAVKGSTNVVRVINADAIKARLASEGRSFRPRPPGGGAGGPQRSFSRVREVRVGQDTGPTPPPADLAAKGTPSAGARAAKKKNNKDYETNAKERRELRSGGYELWLDPGKKKKKKGKTTQITQAAAHKRVVELSGPITVNDLAHKMSVKAGQVVSKLMGMGMMVTVNQPIDPDTAAIVASEFEYEVKNVAFEETEILKAETSSAENLEPRAPVVTVMGHVDHGKTSLLDALRSTNVAAGEAGGITQHIGAHHVETSRGHVTFLDTPGHEAFTSMRARGAEITDIVILVVAADDGVMPQTIEAINHAKAANVPIVVAVNKIDAPGAKPERVLQQLSEHGVIAEKWGGDVQVFEVSALKRQGLEELIEGLITQAEMMELKADPTCKAQGAVVEAKLDKGRGPVATVLVQSGALRDGDVLVAGEHYGRVRAMYNSTGERVEEAGPSIPVLVLGLSGVPMAGDKFNVVEDDKDAKTIASHRAQKIREQELLKTSRVSLENFLKTPPQSGGHELRLIVKADVFGSAEALVAALKALTTAQVKVEVVHQGVGTITESDVNLAVASKAIIIGFNIKPDSKAQDLAAQEKVDVRSYSVIYEVIDEVKKAMAGLLSPVTQENYLGKAEVRMVFPGSKLGQVAGCYVQDGKILRSARVRVKRGKEVVFEGDIASLKRFKDDVREVANSYECGIGLEGFKDFREGDVIECFELKKVAAKLDEALIDKPRPVVNDGAAAH